MTGSVNSIFWGSNCYYPDDCSAHWKDNGKFRLKDWLNFVDPRPTNCYDTSDLVHLLSSALGLSSTRKLLKVADGLGPADNQNWIPFVTHKISLIGWDATMPSTYIRRSWTNHQVVYFDNGVSALQDRMRVADACAASQVNPETLLPHMNPTYNVELAPYWQRGTVGSPFQSVGLVSRLWIQGVDGTQFDPFWGQTWIGLILSDLPDVEVPLDESVAPTPLVGVK